MSGVGMYGPRPTRDQATAALDVLPAGNVMSPRAPGRMTKIGFSSRRPLAMRIRSSVNTGVGAVIFEVPPSRHNSVPVAGSFPRMKLAPLVTSSGARPGRVDRYTVGVPHDGSSSRVVFQTVSPV